MASWKRFKAFMLSAQAGYKYLELREKAEVVQKVVSMRRKDGEDITGFIIRFEAKKEEAKKLEHVGSPTVSVSESVKRHCEDTGTTMEDDVVKLIEQVEKTKADKVEALELYAVQPAHIKNVMEIEKIQTDGRVVELGDLLRKGQATRKQVVDTIRAFEHRDLGQSKFVAEAVKASNGRSNSHKYDGNRGLQTKRR